MKQVILWNGCLTLTLIFWIFHVWDFDFCISALVHKIWIKPFKKWSLILKGSSFKCITFSALYHPMYWCYNPQQIQERFFFFLSFQNYTLPHLLWKWKLCFQSQNKYFISFKPCPSTLLPSVTGLLGIFRWLTLHFHLLERFWDFRIRMVP